MTFFHAAFLSSVVFLACSGCQNPGVVQLSTDIYVVSRSSGAGAFTNMSKLRASVIREANEFAETQGKVAVAINAREVVPAHGFPSYEYQFQLLDKSDPRARGVSLEPRAGVVIEKTVKNVDSETRSPATSQEGGDMYSELKKLDELRRSGILTEEEFAAQKKRVLER